MGNKTGPVYTRNYANICRNYLSQNLKKRCRLLFSREDSFTKTHINTNRIISMLLLHNKFNDINSYYIIFSKKNIDLLQFLRYFMYLVSTLTL